MYSVSQAAKIVHGNACQEAPPEQTKANPDLILLNELEQRRAELLAELHKVDQQIAETRQKITETTAQIKKEDAPGMEATAQKCALSVKLGKPLLIVHKNETVTSCDGSGNREHYRVSLLTKDGSKIEINENWQLAHKYGKIQHIIISDGEQEVELLDISSIKRLKDFFSIQFDTLREQLNQGRVDRNEWYPNKSEQFDCQRFSYSLQHGKEDTYPIKFSAPRNTTTYRNPPWGGYNAYNFYSITGCTNTFGSGKTYDRNDTRVHHFMCLDKDVFVSKFGRDSILFTSYQQIITAYFPEKFSEGVNQIEI